MNLELGYEYLREMYFKNVALSDLTGHILWIRANRSIFLVIT